MNVGLGALDVIVQIVSEQVYQVDGVVPGRAIGVAREEDEGDVAHAVAGARVRALEAARRVAAEQNLRKDGGQ